MPKGFAHPFVLVSVLVLLGIGVAVLAGPRNIAGLVLGATTRKENVYDTKTVGIKVNVVSPATSWDLTEYLCKSRDECTSALTSGKWWSTVSGAATTTDGHEIFIEESDGWADYNFIKIVVKESGSVVGEYLAPAGTNNSYALIDISSIVDNTSALEFK